MLSLCEKVVVCTELYDNYNTIQHNTIPEYSETLVFSALWRKLKVKRSRLTMLIAKCYDGHPDRYNVNLRSFNETRIRKTFAGCTFLVSVSVSQLSDEVY